MCVLQQRTENNLFLSEKPTNTPTLYRFLCPFLSFLPDAQGYIDIKQEPLGF